MEKPLVKQGPDHCTASHGVVIIGVTEGKFGEEPECIVSMIYNLAFTTNCFAPIPRKPLNVYINKENNQRCCVN